MWLEITIVWKNVPVVEQQLSYQKFIIISLYITLDSCWFCSMILIKAHVFGSGFVASFSPRCIFENLKANHVTTVEFLILHLWILFQMPKYLGSDTICYICLRGQQNSADKPARSSFKQQTNSHTSHLSVGHWKPLRMNWQILHEISQAAKNSQEALPSKRSGHDTKPHFFSLIETRTEPLYKLTVASPKQRGYQENDTTKSKLPGFVHYLPRTSHLPFHPLTHKCLKIIPRILGKKKSQKCQGSLSNHLRTATNCVNATCSYGPDHFKRSCLNP